jgi:putative ABC transport system permease protein
MGIGHETAGAEVRESGRVAWFADLGRDLRYAWRQLRQAPGFALTAALTLALGIGVSTALFSVVYGVWIDAYPYRDFREILFPRAFAHNGAFADSQNGVFLQRELLPMAKVPAVAETAAYTLGSGYVTMMGAYGPESVHVFHVPGNTFQFLGVPALIGRTIQPSDIGAGGEAAPVLVLSFNLWQRMFNGDRSIVGRTIDLSGQPHVIVGVMPHRFAWGSATWPTNDGVWLPLATTDTEARLRGWVRLHEGVSWDVASEQFQALFLELAKVPGSFPEQSFYTYLQRFEGGVGGTARYVREMRSSLRFLLYAVGFLLLIACTNVANLQLARGSGRSREVAIRLAVGASRWRLIRQLLTENVVLALAGGGLGVALAIGLTRLIVALIPQGYVPSESEIATNVPVLLFAIGISMLSGILFGMMPAIHGSKSDLNETLKDSGVGSGGVRGLRTRNVLVVVEIALSVLLVMGASLAVRGYLTLERVDPGLNPERLLRTTISFESRRAALRTVAPEQARALRSAPFTPDQVRLLRDLPARLGRLPTLEAVALQQVLPPTRPQIPGEVTPPDGRMAMQAISGGYATALGIPLLRGRDLTVAEVERGEPSALINEAASRLWTGGRDPIGTRVRLDPFRPADTPMEVVIVGILQDATTDEKPQPTTLVPHTTTLSVSAPTLYVRTRSERPLQLTNAIRAEIFALNADVVLENPQDVEVVSAGGRLQPRFNMALFAALAAIALALAAAGVYAVLSYQVARQRREIGIRLALGAGTGRIISTVLGLGGRLVGVGLVVGIAASLGLSRFVTSQVFTVPKLDLVAGLVAVAILIVVAALACYVPARRATRINPLRVLRSE